MLSTSSKFFYNFHLFLLILIVAEFCNSIFNFFTISIFTVLAWKSRLAAEVAVNRINPFKIPFLQRKENELDRCESDVGKDEERDLGRLSGSNSHRGIERDRVRSREQSGFTSQSEKLLKSNNLLPIAKINLQNELNTYKTKRYQLNEKSKHERNVIASLITLRARKKGMKEILEKSLKYCERFQNSSSSQKNGFKSLSELVLACLESVEDNISKKFVDNNYNNNNNNNSDNNDDNDNNHSNNYSNNDNDKTRRYNNNNNRENLETKYNNNKNNHFDEISDQRHIDETNQRAWLGSLLISYPETFSAIIDILGKCIPTDLGSQQLA